MKVKYIGESNPLELINGKVYDAIGQNTTCYGVIDETGEDYLYFKELFEIVNEDDQ